MANFPSCGRGVSHPWLPEKAEPALLDHAFTAVPLKTRPQATTPCHGAGSEDGTCLTAPLDGSSSHFSSCGKAREEGPGPSFGPLCRQLPCRALFTKPRRSCPHRNATFHRSHFQDSFILARGHHLPTLAERCQPIAPSIRKTFSQELKMKLECKPSSVLGQCH